MRKAREIRCRCEICQRKIIQNEINRCGECAIIKNSNNENGGNQERANEEESEER